MPRSTTLTWIALCCTLLVWSAPGAAASSPTPDTSPRVVGPLTPLLTATAQDPLDLTSGDDERRIWELVRRFYKGREDEPAWTAAWRPSANARALVDALRAAEREGLDPAVYRVDEVARRLRAAYGFFGARQPKRHALDLLLTQVFLLYGSHLRDGRIAAQAIDATWESASHEPSLDVVLAEALRRGGVAKTLASLAPPHEGYRLLRRELARYRQIAAEGGWPRVADGATLSPGDEAAPSRRAALERRLAREGFLDPADGDGEITPASAPVGRESASAEQGGARAVYGAPLAAAVARFQSLRGIEPDGVVGPNTVAELNIPAGERVRQIVLNMERWRWLARAPGPRHLRVNVPSFMLTFQDGGRTMTMPVIVGKTSWGTTLLQGAIESIEINPYWHVPESIATDEILPELQRDPGYLDRRNMTLLAGGGDDPGRVDPYRVDWARVSSGDFPYRVRQNPGPGNALGRIKFVLPNRHAIYLHDTPSGHLFERTDRAFSHGCIRVARPVDLAATLLRDESAWSRDRIESAIASGERRVVALDGVVPIEIVYFTAFVNEDGGLEFHQDIYEIDARHAAKLGDALSAPARGV